MSDTTSKQPQIKVTGVGAGPSEPSKEDKVLASRALSIEDEFTPFYDGGSSAQPGLTLIAPPYQPATLELVCQENSAIGPCIDTMETNVDGTGFTIEPKVKKEEPKKAKPALQQPAAGPIQKNEDEKDPVIARLKDFFAEVWPGLSFMALRKLVRRDLERTGNAYIEVIRNLQDEIVFLRHVQSRTMRLLRRDDAVRVDKQVKRGTETLTVPVMVRERRFAQFVTNKLQYFREFGASRHVNRESGLWEKPESPIPFDKRGTEIIHLVLHPDASSPYGVPRWEGAIPSMLGMRKAEIHNLDFFKAGGVPPGMITVSGGQLAEPARQALEGHFGPSGPKHRFVILEVQSTGGSLDSASPVRVQVERFGAERMADAMFQKYDAECERKVRQSYRLPPLFTGSFDGASFATAYTAVLVAESQVFKPERDEFDEMVNSMLLPGLGAGEYEFRSTPLSMADAATKLAALQIAQQTNHIEPKTVVDAVNEIASLELSASDEPVQQPMQANPFGGPDLGNEKRAIGVGSPQPERAGGDKLNKGEVAEGLLALVDETMEAMRTRNLDGLTRSLKSIEGLQPGQKAQFKAALAVRQYLDTGIDPSGLENLAGCTVAAMRAHMEGV